MSNFILSDHHGSNAHVSTTRQSKRINNNDRVALGEVTNKHPGQSGIGKGFRKAASIQQDNVMIIEEHVSQPLSELNVNLSTSSTSSSSSNHQYAKSSNDAMDQEIVHGEIDDLELDLEDNDKENNFDEFDEELAALHDVDSADVFDPQAASQYVRHIYSYLHQNQLTYRPSANYMDSIQRDITPNMRSILMDWLVEVAEEYRLVSDTLFLTVNYIDRYLSLKSVSRSNLQLVGITCCLLASKYEEVYAPSLDDMVYIADHTYSRQDVVNLEAKVITSLEFNLTCATSKVFLRRLLKVAEADARTRLLASFLTELTLIDYDYLVYEPALIASCAVYLALLTMGRDPWDATLQYHAKHDENEMRPCLEKLLETFKASRTHKLQAVREKYSQARLGNVANKEPPVSIPGWNYVAEE